MYDISDVLPIQPLVATLDEDKFRALFGQYFRFDIISQQPYFYREVQRLVSGLCVVLTKEYQRDQVLSLIPFDPVLIFCRSKDRLVDALLDSCLLLVRHGLLEEVSCAVVLRQYSEVSSYFRQKWQSQSNDVPVVDNILSLWLSYPHWQRCAKLFEVLQLIFCGTCVVCIKWIFSLLEQLYFLSLRCFQSWMSSDFIDRTLQSMSGLLRHCESTDTQVLRLHNSENVDPGTSCWKTD